MRLCDKEIPNSQITLVFHASLLMPFVQHLVVAILDVFPKLVYLRQIPINSIVIEMSLQGLLDSLHCISNRFMHIFMQPLLHRLLLCFQFLFARANTQSVFAFSCVRVEERKSKKVEILFRSLESSDRQDSRFILGNLKVKFCKPFLQGFQYFSRFIFILKQHEKIVCVSHIVYFSSALSVDDLFIPQIQYIVQIYVCKYR